MSAHHAHLETEFSFRTRIVDYLWCGLPVVTTGGDELGELIGARGAGTPVAAEDVDGFAAALAGLLDDAGPACGGRRGRARAGPRPRLGRRRRPLVDFCAAPRRAPDLLLGAADRELLGLRVGPARGGPARRAGATLREGGPACSPAGWCAGSAGCRRPAGADLPRRHPRGADDRPPLAQRPRDQAQERAERPQPQPRPEARRRRGPAAGAPAGGERRRREQEPERRPDRAAPAGAQRSERQEPVALVEEGEGLRLLVDGGRVQVGTTAPGS